MATAGISASALTLDFDSLPAEPAVSDIGALVDANGGSRTISGVTFDASDNSDWEIVGSDYEAAAPSDAFAVPHSGDYALAGNAFSGSDFFGNAYTGLSISTPDLMSSLFVGYDDTGFGANDADTLTITAFGAGGDLASISTMLSGPTLVEFDTASTFAALSGITGYRFETTAADPLDEADGRAYVIADDLTFGAPVSEPPVAALLALGLGLCLVATRRRTDLCGDQALPPGELSACPAWYRCPTRP